MKIFQIYFFFLTIFVFSQKGLAQNELRDIIKKYKVICIVRPVQNQTILIENEGGVVFRDNLNTKIAKLPADRKNRVLMIRSINPEELEIVEIIEINGVFTLKTADQKFKFSAKDLLLQAAR